MLAATLILAPPLAPPSHLWTPPRSFLGGLSYDQRPCWFDFAPPAVHTTACGGYLALGAIAFLGQLALAGFPDTRAFGVLLLTHRAGPWRSCSGTVCMRSKYCLSCRSDNFGCFLRLWCCGASCALPLWVFLQDYIGWWVFDSRIFRFGTFFFEVCRSQLVSVAIQAA